MESERKLGGQRSPTAVSGPLAGYSAGFRQALIDRGYARRTIGDQVSMMAHLSRWLQHQCLDVTALQSAAGIDRFFAERRACGCRTRISSVASRPDPHREHPAGGSASRCSAGSGSRDSPAPGCPGRPPRLRSVRRSRSEACRPFPCPALRCSRTPIGSFDGGVPDVVLSCPRRHSSSATLSSSRWNRSRETSSSPRSSVISVSLASMTAATGQSAHTDPGSRQARQAHRTQARSCSTATQRSSATRRVMRRALNPKTPEWTRRRAPYPKMARSGLTVGMPRSVRRGLLGGSCAN